MEYFKQLYHEIVEEADDAIIVANSSGVVIIFNQKAESLFGYSKDEVVGEKLIDLVPEQHKKKHLEGFRDFFRKPYIKGVDFRVPNLSGLHKKGFIIPLKIFLIPIIIKGVGMYGMAIVQRR